MRLRGVPNRWVPLFRLLWFLCFVLLVAAVVLGTVHAIRETYEVRPVFRALALDYDLQDNGQIVIQSSRGLTRNIASSRSTVPRSIGTFGSRNWLGGSRRRQGPRSASTSRRPTEQE